MIISVINRAEGNTARYAEKEFTGFLSGYTNHTIGCYEEADRFFILDICDKKGSLEQHSYVIKGGKYKGKPAAYIYGVTQSSLLTGVYEALGQMGIYFNIDGQVLKNKLDVEALDKTDKEYMPFCRNRGIRQHINFPMDISSYHIEDAKEYIRNLARMKMNSITFHSYTGQWHGYKTDKAEVLAGNFFYGQRHSVPNYKPISNVVSNREYYCIPECENILHDEKQRSVFAVYWLNEVMSAAKEAGMHIDLSIELPAGETQDTLIEISRNVLHIYPHIDALEWISQEGGGAGEAFPLEDISKKAAEMFGGRILENGRLPYIPDVMPSSLPGAMASLKRAVDLYKAKDRIFDGIPEKPIHIGLYVMCRETLKILKHIMDIVLPKDVVQTFLPAHGSHAVANNVKFMDFPCEDWQDSLIYSWVEFDGSMYIQQNSCDGIQQLIDMAKESSKSPSVYGFRYNHWRTAENALTIAYAAEAMIAPVPASGFYRHYADIYGIKDRDAFCEAMTMLCTADTFIRDNLFNIGFCYLGCWIYPHGLGWIREWKISDLDKAVRQFEDIVCMLYKCLESTEDPNGIRKIRFLINRSECSILQIKTAGKLCEITLFADDDHPEKLSEQEKDMVVKRCDEAMDLCRQYIDRHLGMMEDRGCEGTIVSYYATIPVYIDHIKQYFAYGEKICGHIPGTFDNPPAPDTAYL